MACKHLNTDELTFMESIYHQIEGEKLSTLF